MTGLLDSAVCVRLVVTLGHFLWQATALALLAWLAVRAFRVSSPRVRYGVFVLALVGMAACPLVTYPLVDVPEKAPVVAMTPAPEPTPPLPQPSPVPATPEEVGPTAPIHEPRVETEPAAPVTDFVPPDTPTEASVPMAAEVAFAPPPEANSPWKVVPALAPYVALAYLLGVLLMFGRLLLALWGGRRLRLLSEPADDPTLLTALARRAKAIGLKVTPAIAYCRRLAVPVVVGVLRPVLLLPPALAAGLSAEQLEAVLSHELAHIRRYDHLVNLLQRVIESLLFFHPAVWLVSRRIRIEREHCCDDMAVVVGGDRQAYAESMLRVAELGFPDTTLGRATRAALLGAAKEPSELRRRIVRLFRHSAHERIRLSRTWPIALAAIGAVLLAGTLLLDTQPGQAGPPTEADPPATQPTQLKEPTQTGLRCTIEVEKAALRVGGKLRIDVRLANVTDKPVTIPWHFHASQLVITNTKGEAVKSQPTGVAGPRSAPVPFKTLEPDEILLGSFEGTIAYEVGMPKDGLRPKPVLGIRVRRNLLQFLLNDPGDFRVRLDLIPDKRRVARAVAKGHKNVWQTEVRSNTAAFSVRTATRAKLDAAIKDLSADTLQTRRDAIRLLAMHCDLAAAPAMAKLLTDGPPELRHEAAGALRGIRDPAIAPGLLDRHGKETSSDQRRRLLGVVERSIGCKGLVPAYLRVAKADVPWPERHTALGRLFMLRRPEVVPILIALSKSNDQAEQKAAIPHMRELLLRTGGQHLPADVRATVTDRLIALMAKAEDSHIRGQAAEALRWAKGPKVVPALLTALKDPNLWVGSYASGALGQRTGIEVIPALRDYINRADKEGQKDAARKAIEAIRQRQKRLEAGARPTDGRGPAHNGLRCMIEVEKKTVRVGGKVRIDLRLENATDEPVTIPWHFHPEQLIVTGRKGKAVDMHPTGIICFAREVPFTTLAPGEILLGSFEGTPAYAVQLLKDGRRPAPTLSIRFGDHLRSLDVREPGDFRVQLVLTPDKQQVARALAKGHKNVWRSKVSSNTVTFSVQPAARAELDTAIQDLWADSLQRRRDAIRVLAVHCDLKAAPALAKLLTDGPPELRDEAAGALRGVRDPSIAPGLLDRHGKETSSDQRRRLLGVVECAIGSKRLAQIYLRVAKADVPWKERSRAIGRLVSRGRPEVVPIVIALSKSTDQTEQKGTISHMRELLLATGGRELPVDARATVVDRLIALMLGAEDRHVRGQAAEALRWGKGPKPVHAETGPQEDSHHEQTCRRFHSRAGRGVRGRVRRGASAGERRRLHADRAAGAGCPVV